MALVRRDGPTARGSPPALIPQVATHPHEALTSRLKLAIGANMDIKVEGLEGQLGANGILLRISEPKGGAAKGRLWVGKAKLRWYKGKTNKNFKEVSITEFIDWLDSH